MSNTESKHSGLSFSTEEILQYADNFPGQILVSPVGKKIGYVGPNILTAQAKAKEHFPDSKLTYTQLPGTQSN